MMPIRRVWLLLLAAAAGTAGAEPLGRLFFTPERRSVLEHQRASNVQATQTLEGASMSFDGVVVRSGGKSTVWINGRPQPEAASGTGVQAAVDSREPARATVVAGEEVPAELRVGEAINRATREKNDVVVPGAITVRKPRPAAR